MNYLSKINHPGMMVNLLGDFPVLTGTPEIKDNTAIYEDNALRFTARFTDCTAGITRRVDMVENISGHPITIRTALSRFHFNGGEYEVYTQYSRWIGESQGTWTPLHTSVAGSNSDVRSNTTAAPFFALHNKQTGRSLAFHILADGMWKFEVSQQYKTNNITYVQLELGLDNSNFALTLQPGESFTLPTILYYEFTNRVDLEAYRLHRYCKEVYHPKALPMVYNTWMNNFDRVTLDNLTQQLQIAKGLGLEYFVMDAGWFGAPNAWFDSVGDWEESPESSLQGQLLELANRVRAQGLKFGLWFELERAALKSKTAQAHPEFYHFQNGHAFLDFGNPDACDYLFDIVAKHIRHYGIEYIKFDYNAPLNMDKDQLAFTKYMAGFRGFMDRLAREFPNLYRECCASGGLRMSLSSMDSFDSFWISDNHSLYAQLNIFKNTLIRMPPRVLETWMSIRSIEKFDPVYNGDFTEKILSSGDSSWNRLEVVPESFLYACVVGGPIGLSCDLTRLSVTTREKLAALIAQVKADRPFWQNAECHILCDTPSMLVLQFCDENFDHLKVYAYSKAPQQNNLTVYPLVTPGVCYTHSNGAVYTAEALTVDGLDIPIKGICAVEFTLTKA